MHGCLAYKFLGPNPQRGECRLGEQDIVSFPRNSSHSNATGLQQLDNRARNSYTVARAATFRQYLALGLSLPEGMLHVSLDARVLTQPPCQASMLQRRLAARKLLSYNASLHVDAEKLNGVLNETTSGHYTAVLIYSQQCPFSRQILPAFLKARVLFPNVTFHMVRGNLHWRLK